MLEAYADSVVSQQGGAYLSIINWKNRGFVRGLMWESSMISLPHSTTLFSPVHSHRLKPFFIS